jgi:hypothetical protein
VSDVCSDSPGDVFFIGEDGNVFNDLFLLMCVPRPCYISYVGFISVFFFFFLSFTLFFFGMFIAGY